MALRRRLGSAKKRLALALLAGVAAAVLMFLYAGSLEARANSAQNAAIDEYGGTRTEVLVATRDLLAGEELSAENTAMMPWLSGLLPQGAITNPEEAYTLALSLPVWANEPILAVKLGSGEELIQVPDGLVAVSIPISDDMAVGGSLLPGSSVDLYAVGASRVSLVLADALVLEASNGVGSVQTGDAKQAGIVLGGSSRAALKWVTLAVRDETVAELLSAARDNTLSLVLPGQNAGAALREPASGDARLSEADTDEDVSSEESASSAEANGERPGTSSNEAATSTAGGAAGGEGRK
ncbi:MAG: Flp pilus assembly protein CpaB [Coriobacteriales bacterium]|jgi:pilus assembly protein CpaB|nr:Flp pilus assembly protein CpaB [Coriobacteriales bacterium]